ncbi:MAG: redox-regulated ATPase YchF [Chloroflexi bacterium]|nr:redox-regulated ATPase YchF [Chloroflexota bacterium]
MEIGIVGLPQTGKTSIFLALTRGKTSAGSGAAPNIGVAKVYDSRVAALEKIFKPRKTTYAEIKYIDMAATFQGKGEGIRGEFLSHISNVDAIMEVVRVFDDPSVPHVEGSVDSQRDIAAMDLELAFSDMAIIERRLQKLEASLRAPRAQRELMLKEQTLLQKIKAGLEEEVQVRDMDFSEEECRTIENFQFLTAKPLIIVLNIGENRLAEAPSLEQQMISGHKGKKFGVFSACARLEAELSQLSEEEAGEFRASLGLKESAIDKIARISYDLLDLMSFFTVGPDEVKAWTIRKGMPAVKAAGKIHSDLEKGFIRAEVIGYDDFMQCGSMAEAKKRGLFRLEGKTYEVRDGDIMNILFNV